MKITILKMRRNLDADEAYVYEGWIDKNALVPTILEFFNHDQPTSEDLRELGYGSGGYESYESYYADNDGWVDVDFRETLTFADRVKERIRHCCRTDENGEDVDKSEHSDSDVTLAVVSGGAVACMECGSDLLTNQQQR